MSYTTPIYRRSRLGVAATITVLAMLGMTACGTTNTASTSELPAANPYGHVHAIAFDESTQRVLLATHNGLFDATGSTPKKIGPTMDLMGFAISSAGTLYASGHPGPGSDLSNPVGLIESTDGGDTWTPVSLEGQSDFHALAASRGSVIGFDGKLRTTTDGREWVESGPMSPIPYALVGHKENTIVLANTEEGLWRSANGGETWSAPGTGPLLLTAAFADLRTVVGVTPEGSLYLSKDTGLSWEAMGAEVGQATALGATRTDEGALLLWMDLVDRGLVKFTYDGTTLSEETP